MNARTHDAIAFASLVTVAAINPPSELTMPTVFAAVVGNIVGSLIPDLDQATNRLWDLLPGGNAIGRVFRRLFLRHRTLSHSLVGIIIFDYILWKLLPVFVNPGYINPWLVHDAMMIGVVSHLAADALTKEGIPLLFPLPWKFGFPPLSALRIRTGSWVENYLVLPGTAAYIFWFIGRNQGSFIALLHLIRTGA